MALGLRAKAGLRKVFMTWSPSHRLRGTQRKYREGGVSAVATQVSCLLCEAKVVPSLCLVGGHLVAVCRVPQPGDRGPRENQPEQAQIT